MNTSKVRHASLQEDVSHLDAIILISDFESKLICVVKFEFHLLLFGCVDDHAFVWSKLIVDQPEC